MIVTVTLNPALHVGYETEQVRLGGANPVRRVSYRTGGRGLAVARVLHTFGHDVVAAGLAGGASGPDDKDPEALIASGARAVAVLSGQRAGNGVSRSSRFYSLTL